MSFIGIDTAIGWAHWQMRGGWKNTLVTTMAYAGVVIAAILVTVRIDPKYTNEVLSGWRLGLLWLEGGILVLFAASRVAAAVRSDIASRMIESHRLMPVAPLSAISGYLWGATSQSIILAGATFLIGLVVTTVAGYPAGLWIGPSLVLASFGVFCWIFMAFVASVSRASAGLVGVVGFLSFSSQGVPLFLMPGLMVLLSPFIGRTIFQMSLANAEVRWPLLVSLSAQVYVGAIFYIGAARKYRRSEDSALGVIPAMLLLAGWVGISAIAILQWDEFVPFMLVRMRPGFEVMLIGSLFSVVGLALMPVANSARVGGSSLRAVLVAVLCAALIWPLSLAGYRRVDDPHRAMLTTAAVCGLFLIASAYILRIAYRITARGWVPMLVWILIAGTGPIISDSVLWGMQLINSEFVLTSISSASPAGAIVMVWNSSKASVLPGLIFQAACALGWAGLFHLTEKRPKSARS